jgi:signal transduction histidine kinase
LTPIETPAGQVVGYFTLSRPRDDRDPTLETVQTVEIFVNQVAIALENARLFAALEERLNQARRVNELAALNRLSTAVASSLDMESILKAAVQETARTLRPDISALWLLPHGQDPPRPQAIHYLHGTDEFSLSSLVSAGVLDTVIQDDRSLRLDGLNAEQSKLPSEPPPRLQHNEPGPAKNLPSAMLAPLVVRDQKIGIIGVFAGSKEAFDDRDLTLLDSMASAVAMAIENARLYAESKNFATELAASQAQLIQSAKLAATGKLAASIAHEINNPLQAVQSCVYLIADGAHPDDPNVKYVDIAREELDRIARIVGRMLSFHQPTTDAKEPTDVNDLIENILALVHKRLQHSRVAVETELATDLPTIHTVRDHIKQVLLNLFLNALEAMPQGGTLRIQTAKAAHRWVTIAIQDHGLGIQPEDIAHLFDPFYTTKPKGTGLGLSISYDIVAQHGGEILVDSELGKGTTFTIRLPSQKGATAWKSK